MDPNISAQPTPPMAPETQSVVLSTPEQSSQPKLELSKWIIIAVVVLLLIVGSISAYVLSKNFFKTTTNLPSPTSVSMESTKPTSTPDPTASWKTYQNNELGFSIKHPNQYSVVTGEEIVKRDNPQIGIPYMFLKISSTEAANNFVLIKARTDAFKTIKESFIALKNPMVFSTEISVGGLSAKRYSVNYNDPVIGKCQGKANGVVIEKGDSNYILFTCDQNLETFNQMLSSFKFNDQSSQTVATPTPTTDPTANWKIYSVQGISYQYPESWKTQYNFTNYADTAVYDPNSMHTVVGNGGSQTQQPTVFFDVQKVINTTQIAKSYADEYTSGIPYNQFTATELQRQSKLANGIQIELFTAQGEGNIGKYLILSNGVKIAVVNTSLVSLNGEEVENLILSTFKFTQ